ncbi:uncharacterized protein LOC142219979 [Haematobia irritans]|uniref:uncharacterized protein LOC142219979 n=1 Tax=Haematobia irritans TaxID=7368 RepID=UPI003F4F861F
MEEVIAEVMAEEEYVIDEDFAEEVVIAGEDCTHDRTSCNLSTNTDFWLRAIELVAMDPFISDVKFKYYNVRSKKLLAFKEIEDKLRQEFENLPRGSFLARKLAGIRRNAIRSHQSKGDKSKNPFIEYALRWKQQNNERNK